MATHNDGEFELVLGNKQLLSVFFIVAVLIGVFFTMGYIVGRNSAPGIASADSGAARKPDKPVEAQRPSATGTPSSPLQSPPPAADSGPVGAAAEQKQREGAVNGSSSAPAPDARRNDPNAEAEAEGAAPSPEVPPSGTYLQVAAVSRSEAELLVEVMGKRGFHALFSPVPEKPGLFRVLVGPLADAAAIGQTRTDLVKAGFKGYDAIVKKF